jgi:chromosome partitioning protein
LIVKIVKALSLGYNKNSGEKYFFAFLDNFMGKTIAIVNQKGGVGKTTTCVNLTAALKELNQSVLLCDCDPQANSTSGMGVDKATASPNIYDILINGAEPARAVIKTPYGDIIASNKMLSGAGIEMVSIPGREYLLRNAVLSVSKNYDFILIDCPPSLELLTLNALCAADSILIPVQCEYYALEGLSDLMATVRTIRRVLNTKLEIEGVLLTMFDGRTNLSMQVAEEVKRHFPGKVCTSVIPRNVRLSEAPSHGKPILQYDRLSRGTEAYLDLARETIRKNISLPV